MRFSLVCSSVALTLASCDIGENKLGDETMSGGVDGSGSAGDSDSAGETDGAEGGSAESGGGGDCEPGDQQPLGDGCNVCICDESGFWSCNDEECPACNEGDVTTNLAGCVCNCIDGDFVCPESCECELGDQMPAPDGCNTCTCGDDGSWGCSEMECPPANGDPFDGPDVAVCDAAVPLDPVVITAVTLEGDSLTVDLAYSGGCEMHLLGGCWDETWAESLPVQTGLAIAHESNDDPCDAFPSDQVVLDLTPIAVGYQNSYGPGPATVHINLAGWSETIVYEF